MGRPRTGTIKEDKARGLFVVRYTYHDQHGKRRDLRRTTQTRTEANRLLNQFKRDYEDSGAKALDAERMTFRQLAEKYQAVRLVEPRYENGQKIGGLRSWRDQQRRLKKLAEYFGNRRIRIITFGDLETYKRQRLDQTSNRNQPVTIASANRELALLRSVFGYAVQERWLNRSPFDDGNGLISLAVESKRDRVLTREEELRLLAVCENKERQHVRPVLVTALDTAARKGELLRLRWSDVNLLAALITLTSYKGKKMTSRTVGMTARLKAELQRLAERAPEGRNELVFGIKQGFYKAFETACRLAGIEDFRFHDCRHTAITRMVQSGMPHTEIMKLSGHTVFATFERYVNASHETARRGADALDLLTRQIEEATAVTEYVN